MHFQKEGLHFSRGGLQHSKGVCKRVVMSSFGDTCNRNPPLGFVSPNGGYVSCSPIIYITISSFDFKYMTSVITQILYLSFVNFNLHMIIDIHKESVIFSQFIGNDNLS